MSAFERLCRTEGIIPAIESSHALAGALRLARRWEDAGEVSADTPSGQERIIVVNLSGRGDKDVSTAAKWFDMLPDAPTPEGGDAEAVAARPEGAQD